METPIEIPQEVIEALAEVRKSGAVNMIDRRGVICELRDMDELDAVIWLDDNKKHYMDALNAMGKSLKQ